MKLGLNLPGFQKKLVENGLDGKVCGSAGKLQLDSETLESLDDTAGTCQ